MRRDQIDRNYGLTRGWLVSVTYDGELMWSAWSQR